MLALAQRENGLFRMLVARRRQNHCVDAGTIDALLEIGRMKRNLPLAGKCLAAFWRAACYGHDLDVIELPERLYVRRAHGAGPCQTNLHCAIPPGSDLDFCEHPNLPTLHRAPNNPVNVNNARKNQDLTPSTPSTGSMSSVSISGRIAAL